MGHHCFGESKSPLSSSHIWRIRFPILFIGIALLTYPYTGRLGKMGKMGKIKP